MILVTYEVDVWSMHEPSEVIGQGVRHRFPWSHIVIVRAMLANLIIQPRELWIARPLADEVMRLEVVVVHGFRKPFQ